MMTLQFLIIINPRRDNASEFVNKPKVRMLGMDNNTPFHGAGVEKTTHNLNKSQVVVNIKYVKKVQYLCNITILGQ